MPSVILVIQVVPGGRRGRDSQAIGADMRKTGWRITGWQAPGALKWRRGGAGGAETGSGVDHEGPRRLPLPDTWRRLDVLLASVLINLFGLGMPFVVLQVYDRILPNQAVDTFWLLLLLLVGVAIVESMLRIGRSVILAWYGARYEHQQSMALLDSLLRCDLLRFESSATGTYLDRIQSLEKIREFYSGQSVLLLVDLPFVLIFLSLIFCFAGPLVIVPLGFIALFIVISYVLGKQLRRALSSQSSMDERRQNFLIEALTGIHTVKSMAMEAPMMRRYERLQAQSAESVYDLSRINSLVQGVGASFSQVVMVTFVAVGSMQVVNSNLTIGALAAGTMLSGRVLQPALKAMGLWTHMQSVELAREKTESVLNLPSEAVSRNARPVRLRGAIELNDIHFRHEGASHDLLAGISMQIQPGEWIGITGANGVGKSTLLNLIIGFMSPARGRVLLDGQLISELDRSSVRAQIGLMPQKGVMFEGTILENMTLFRDGRMIDEAIELTCALGLDDAIRQLPQGLDTRIGGSMVDVLSEGMRNRIIIVRAIVGQPPILLFDDANCAFDAGNDDRLMALLRSLKGKRTMVMVSHRPSLLRLCDRQYTLQDGRLEPRTEQVFGAPGGVAPTPATVPPTGAGPRPAPKRAAVRRSETPGQVVRT
ncbi:MAG: peptidase domain-containing ABC transporter [Gammaproteobacteria bacterium]|nr:peptidase domain-containing ABC transporter [Gammaproteobacteria bacterium]